MSDAAVEFLRDLLERSGIPICKKAREFIKRAIEVQEEGGEALNANP